MLWGLVVVLSGVGIVLYTKLKKLRNRISNDRNDYYKNLQIKSGKLATSEQLVKELTKQRDDFSSENQVLVEELNSLKKEKSVEGETLLKAQDQVELQPQKRRSGGKKPRN